MNKVKNEMIVANRKPKGGGIKSCFYSTGLFVDITE
jgi:hypothetical protein